ncbi:hypothetical protein [Clostridioides difficile]|uniref:hypothetical protein n=1 Tax=Clostridioides difficile TaxID=1496 RepID=UPI001F1FA42C|nr:hypothetical protein [Clostridioides difficile]
MNIFIEIIKLNMYMSLPIILFILFNKKLLVKYTAMFSYTFMSRNNFKNDDC